MSLPFRPQPGIRAVHPMLGGAIGAGGAPALPLFVGHTGTSSGGPVSSTLTLATNLSAAGGGFGGTPMVGDTIYMVGCFAGSGVGVGETNRVLPAGSALFQNQYANDFYDTRCWAAVLDNWDGSPLTMSCEGGSGALYFIVVRNAQWLNQHTGGAYSNGGTVDLGNIGISMPNSLIFAAMAHAGASFTTTWTATGFSLIRTLNVGSSISLSSQLYIKSSPVSANYNPPAFPSGGDGRGNDSNAGLGFAAASK